VTAAGKKCATCGAALVNVESGSYGRVQLHASPACDGFKRAAAKRGELSAYTAVFVGFVQRPAPAPVPARTSPKRAPRVILERRQAETSAPALSSVVSSIDDDPDGFGEGGGW
jgi:hypothetical protein